MQSKSDDGLLRRSVDMLRNELAVLKQQLKDEKEISAMLRDEVMRLETSQWKGNNTTSNNDEREDLLSRVVDSSPGENPEDPPRGDTFRANGGFGFRYVPPLDFLPPVFVEQYLDVITIIDRYAQLYHKYHVGGGSRDPSIVIQDVDAARSAVELRDARIQELETQVGEQAATIGALKDQLQAWRATGANRRGYDPSSSYGRHEKEEPGPLPNGSRYRAAEDGDDEHTVGTTTEDEDKNTTGQHLAGAVEPALSRRKRSPPRAAPTTHTHAGGDNVVADRLATAPYRNHRMYPPSVPKEVGSRRRSKERSPVTADGHEGRGPTNDLPDLQALYAPPRTLFSSTPAAAPSSGLSPATSRQYAPTSTHPVLPWSSLVS